MKILQVHTRYRQAGGEDTIVDAEAELLREAGHTVVPHQASNPEEAFPAAAALAQAPFNRGAQRRVIEAVRRHRPDVAHVHNTWFAMSPSVIRGLHHAGVPVVMTLHNYRLLCANGLLYRDGAPCEDCVGSHPWHGLQHRCYRQAVGASAAAAATITANRALSTWELVQVFLAPTQFARRRFVAAGLPAERIRVKPHFAQDPGPRPASPSASPTVLFVGRLSAEKGLGLLLAAWERLGDAGLELVVIGDGPERGRLEATRTPHVRFVGRQPTEAVRWWMLRSRALVLPGSYYEAFGMVVAEAMAAGLRVVVSDHGAAAELVAPLGREWLARPGDVRAWTGALAHLSDGAAADEQGAAGRTRYEEAFSKGVALEPLVMAYQDARLALAGTRA